MRNKREHLVYIGELRFLKRVESPWKAYYFMEKYERMRWHKSMFDRKLPDYCAGLQNSAEPWYSFTSSFKQKSCPFDAGHIETFDMVPIANVPDYIPFSFVGKYRVTFLSYFIDDDGSKVTDCMRLGLEIIKKG